VQSWTAAALGGAPTIIAGSEQFLAYQRGTVEIGMTGASAVASRKLYEVMDHMTLSYDSAIEFVAVINNDVFESIPADQQRIILEAAEEVETSLRNFMIDDEERLVDSVRQDLTVIELTDAQRAAFREATADRVDRCLAGSGELGAAAVEAAMGL
jgi:C4-dicarboxylate-binding protein DctP